MGKIQVVDLFCGAGGLSAGFSLNRAFEVIGAADLHAESLDTYRRNIRCKKVFNVDLGAIASSAERLSEFVASLCVDRSRPLVVVGGPPCQGFSAHSKKQRRAVDARNDLVAAFAKIAVALNPDLVAFENVPEAMTEKNWKHFKPMLDAFRAAGYTLSAQVHNFAEYGVPQERFRALCVASKGAIPTVRPTHAQSNYATVRQAISHLPCVEPGQVDADPMHFCANHRKSTIETIKKIPKNGGSRPQGVGPKCLAGVDGFRDVYGRLSWDRPAVTITASARNPASGRFSHPEQDRGLTVREAALLQGFPPHYHFEGSFDSKFLQIGNAVPPKFSVVLAKAIVECFKQRFQPQAQAFKLVPLKNSFSSAIFAMKKRPDNAYEPA